MIKMKSLKLKELRVLQQEMKDVDKNLLLTGDFDELIKMSKLAGKNVIEWDLKDVDTGEVLALPSENENIFEEMTQEQIKELFETFKNSQEGVPNSNGDNS